MKITTIETYQLRCPLGEPFGWSQGWIDHRTTGIVKIMTDAGIVGWGEGCTGPAAAVIGEIFAPLLLGADPLNRNGLWQTMFTTLYNANQAVGFGGSAMSAIDTALWDIAGKVADQPIAALLGGAIRNKVAVYATGLYYTKNELPTKLLAEAKGYVDAGFQGMKTKVGGLPIAEDVKRVAALRRAIGDAIYLMVDANEGYNAATAIQIGRQLTDLNLHWFEEPVNAQDLAGYVQVKAALPLALAGGEALRTRYEFAPFLTSHAFDIAQPDVVNVGGISELRTVAMTANTLGIQVNPHVWGSPIMIAATLQVAATLPPCPPARNPQPFAQEPTMEFDRTPSAIRETLCRVPFNQVDGFIAVPQGPGLGIEVDEQALVKLTIQRDRYAVGQ